MMGKSLSDVVKNMKKTALGLGLVGALSMTYGCAETERRIWDSLTPDKEGEKGYAEIKYKDGRRYVGEYIDVEGLRYFHGEGILYDKNNKVIRAGRWLYQQPVEDNKEKK